MAATVNSFGSGNHTSLGNAHNGGGNGGEDFFHDFSEEGTTLIREDLQALYGYGKKEDDSYYGI